MKNIVKSQHQNSTGSLESIKLSNDTNVSRSEVIRNINNGSQTYSTLNEEKNINVVDNNFLRIDKLQTKSDNLGKLSIV